MSELKLHPERYPDALWKHAQVGEMVEVTVKGRVYRIEEDLVDVTEFGSPHPQVLPGERTLTILITELVT